MADLSGRALLGVGSYSDPVPHGPQAHGRGLEILDLDQDSGDAIVLFTSADLVNPGFFIRHPSLPVVYVGSESWTAAGTVTSLRFSPDFRTLLATETLPSGGDLPCYLSVVGSLLLLANYGDGSLAVFRLGIDGDLLEQTSLLRLSGSGPDPERQTGPHAHCVTVHPYNGFVYATDLGSDAVLRLSLNEADGVLTVEDRLQLAPGAGPRHLAFAPDGRTAFVVEELASTLAILDIDAEGSLSLRQRLSLLPETPTAVSFAADIAISLDGTTVFASNRGHDSVVVVQLGADGSWRAVSWVATGAIPRGLALSPDGGSLLVACQEADVIDRFAVRDGGLVALASLPSATPTCVRWLTGIY